MPFLSKITAIAYLRNTGFYEVSMPIYEYECKKCGCLEILQGVNDAPLSKCPECNGKNINKLLSAPAFHLKGNGWYATDFKNPPAAASCQKEDTASAGGCGAGECKSSTATDSNTATAT